MGSGFHSSSFRDGRHAHPVTRHSAEQLAEAERFYQTLRRATEDEYWQIAQPLAPKTDDTLLGQTEYELRDLTHTTGAKAIQAALNYRKRGGTAGPA